MLVCLAIALARPASGQEYLLRPERVFDGAAMHAGWSVLVEDGRIVTAGPTSDMRVPEGIRVIELDDATLLPGLIEGHGHLLLSRPASTSASAATSACTPTATTCASSSSWSNTGCDRSTL